MFKWLAARYNRAFDEWHAAIVARMLQEQSTTPTGKIDRSKRSIPQGTNLFDFAGLVLKVVVALWLPIVSVGLVLVLVSWLWNSVSHGYLRPEQPPIPRSLPQVPEVIVHPTEQAPFAQLTWLTPSEAEALRREERVVNFAYVQGQSVSYSTVGMSFYRGEPWVQVERPRSLEAFSVNRHDVTIIVQGHEHHLNVRQPFTVVGYEHTIWIVDLDGSVWQVGDDAVAFMPVKDVKNGLDINVRPNPKLSLTYH